MTYKTSWEEDSVKIIVTGEFDNSFLNASVKATTDPRFIDAKYAIVDFNNVDHFPIDSNIIRQISESDARAYKLNPNIKLAIIANKLVMTGLVNMYKTYFELSNNEKTWEMKIFNDENEAREWINA